MAALAGLGPLSYPNPDERAVTGAGHGAAGFGAAPRCAMLAGMNPRCGALLVPLALAACVSGGARAPVVEVIDSQDVVRALLREAADRAVNRLGQPDGFWANARVRIGVPPPLARIDQGLRRYGLERVADEFVMSLNRAAERAMPATKSTLFAAVRGLVPDDAAGLVRGGDGVATAYLRAQREAELSRAIKPIVAATTAESGVTAAYKRLLQKGAIVERIAEPSAFDLDAYVTQRALDGVWLLMAEEEQRLRRHPETSGSELLQKAFR
jgi:hypothetical protein